MVDAHSGWARVHTKILDQLGKDLLEACELWPDNRFDLGIEKFKENMNKMAELMVPRSECAAKKMAKANAAMCNNLGKLRNQLITVINVTNTSTNVNASRPNRKGKEG
ncbi:hypothetical protein LPJ66_010508, partial [Kickxella alabastrina]